MLEDPKSAALLEDGFGGDLGDTKLKFSVVNVPVSQLMPTQKEIDLDKSLKYALTSERSFKRTFKTVTRTDESFTNKEKILHRSFK